MEVDAFGRGFADAAGGPAVPIAMQCLCKAAEKIK
jgi:hypothetical protein